MTATPLTRSAIDQTDIAALILRVTNGAFFFVHGALKLFVFTPAGTAGFFESIGLPGFLAYIVIAAETLGGIALVAGFWTRLVSLSLIPILLGSIWSVHLSAGFLFSNQGGGWEYPAFWAVVLVVQSFLGGGAYALDRRA